MCAPCPCSNADLSARFARISARAAVFGLLGSVAIVLLSGCDAGPGLLGRSPTDGAAVADGARLDDAASPTDAVVVDAEALLRHDVAPLPPDLGPTRDGTPPPPDGRAPADAFAPLPDVRLPDAWVRDARVMPDLAPLPVDAVLPAPVDAFVPAPDGSIPPPPVDAFVPAPDGFVPPPPVDAVSPPPDAFVPPSDAVAPDAAPAADVGAPDAALPPDAGRNECKGCHGSAANIAPPRDTHGQTSTAETGVGAHQAHLRDAVWHRRFDCSECHLVPSAVEDPGHLDFDGVAEVTFGALAGTAGVNPDWDGTSCSTYCHGATLAGGTISRPEWTRVDQGQAACGTCHAVPPGEPHPPVANFTCTPCHPDPMRDGRHLNGVFDLDIGCDGCHGNADNFAPPRDTHGNMGTQIRGVGAHQAHLRGGDWHQPVACNDCHHVPGDIRDPQHLDGDGRAELNFGAKASLGGVTPSWNGTSCSVYCHGASLPGGAHSEPVWTDVGSGQTDCNGCHGAPPPAPHVPVVDGKCTPCHPDPRRDGQHLDGRLEVQVDCGSCHGSEDSAAPPKGLRGEVSTSDRAVGAHQSHLRAAAWHAPLQCSDCHHLPVGMDDPLHLDGDNQAEVTFGTVATAGDLQPVWDGETCQNTWCHGGALPGGLNTAPIWTQVDDSQVFCGSCHAAPPPAPHPNVRDFSCRPCHPDPMRDGQHVNGVLDLDVSCTSCHGGADGPAPPQDTHGNQTTDARGVGAHQSHLRSSNWRATIACTECHIVPATVGARTHIDGDGRPEVTFGARATSGGLNPAWNGVTCANTWCHGGDLPGGTNRTPTWTRVDGRQAACGTCHAVPPPAPHPVLNPNASCSGCHPFNGRTPIDPETHANGILDVNVNCTSCHGGANGPAPPQDTRGEVTTDARGVGAHQSHLNGGAWHRPVVCEDCHKVPQAVGERTHIDGDGTAELTFGALAASDGVTPDWNGTSCSVYCHGASLPGGTTPMPVWTEVGTGQAACGGCHGVPPPAPHMRVPNGDCTACHPDPLNGGQHIDGTLEVKVTCTSCHGGADGPAPPRDTSGNVDTASRGVGAHQSHLNGGNWHRTVTCPDCHKVPVAVGDASHMDGDGVAELTFGALASAQGVLPDWNGTSCSVYCHGANLGGGTASRPVWTQVGTGQADCGGCHGVPPPAPHPALPPNIACGGCHPFNGRTPIDGQTHANGVVEVNATCTACHGGANGPAPPKDTHGNQSTVARGVGAHQSHLNGGNWHQPVGCDDCHRVPATAGDPGHLDGDGRAELTFGPLASADGVTPQWDGAACSVYCHGATLPGGTASMPVWTEVGTGQAACGSCHGVPPPAPHVQTPDGQCTPCHPDPVRDGQHIDGRLEVQVRCNSCHGGADSNAPPRDTAGNTLTTARGVGAHQSHLNGGNWHRTVTCADCHKVPATVAEPTHMDGDRRAELTFGALASANGVQPAWDGASCSVYCHGATLGGGTASRPVWTQVGTGQADCGGCHGVPPPAPHPVLPANAACSGCHPFNGRTPIDPQTHANGILEVNASCTACHGGANGPAPPQDTHGNQLTTARGVGAHQAHLNGGNWHRPVNCADCHRVPANVGEPTHLDGDGRAELTFSALASSDGVRPTWDGATCSVYCHGASLGGGAASRPVWTQVGTGQAACGGCHGVPPPAPHVRVPDGQCTPCHPDPVRDGQHIDGTLEVQVTCSSCHGGADGPAPPRDTSGNVATASRGVGAHAAHLRPSNWHVPVPCAECHRVPADYRDAGHMDGDGRAEVTFGARASADGAAPVWNGASCSVYCHGATLPGGVTPTPIWTQVGTGQADCGGCHGVPPPAPHPAVSPDTCTPCHPVPQTDGKHIDGTLDLKMECTACHGGPAGPAPPTDTHGSADTTHRGVGAHATHLAASNTHAPIACGDCHLVPASVLDPTHLDGDGVAEVNFGPRASTDGVDAQWNGVRCSVYCHGASLSGGANTAPQWTRVGQGEAACGTCHAVPPPLPHVRVPDGSCGRCHPMDPANPGAPGPRHINGIVEANVDCHSCHGSAASPAPPVDLSGNSTTNNRGVGAHQSHLATSNWRASIACEECHVVPATVGAAGHMDGDGVPEVAFGVRATSGGQSPTWNGVTCRNTWCHGGGLPGGTNTTPTWTRVDGTQAACGTCHGAPPAAPHPVVAPADGCGPCHPFNGRLPVDPQRHADGVLDVNVSCNACHGGAAGPAPPRDNAGNVTTNNRGVGAHQSHLQATNLHAAVACTECHIVPQAIGDPGHRDGDGRAEVTFGALARMGGGTATWNGATCSQTYCHGVSIAGGTNKAPTWTRVDGTQTACGTCHGAPPPAPHPVVAAGAPCSPCHPFTGRLPTFPARHMDGILDVNVACNSCHGSAANPAPPRDLAGNVGTASRGVGAHQSHLRASTWHVPLSCGDCHIVPATVGDATHMDTDGRAEVTFGTLANSVGAAPSWDGNSCSRVYCHGDTLSGGANVQPLWTRVDGSQAACGTCHGLPPAGTHHMAGFQCFECHGNVVDQNMQIINPSLHMNAQLDIVTSCPSCHELPPHDQRGDCRICHFF